MKDCLIIHKLFLLLFCSTEIINSSDNSVRFWNTFSNYITASQKSYIQKQFPVIKPTHAIEVQTNCDLCLEEKKFVENRSKKIQEALENYFDIQQPLKIGFCCSGGGNRAMIGSLGLLSGAAKTHLLDATLYLAGVSGSTWMIIPYLVQTAYLEKDSQNALVDLYTYYIDSLSKGTRFCISDHCTPSLLKMDQIDDFIKNLTICYGYNQDITLVDLFGPLIANQVLGFLGDQALHITWSMLADKAIQGNTPLPLCTAAFNNASLDYQYLEMSPFQSGNKTLGYIPTEYLGSEFTNKKLDINGIRPEYPLSYYLGLYGSAFAQVSQDIYRMQQSKYNEVDTLLYLFEKPTMKKYIQYKSWNLFYSFSITHKIQDIIKNIVLRTDLDLYAKFLNYNPEALDHNRTLGLFDAGIGCNFPISVFTDRPERNLDIIIMYDSHPGSSEVQKVYEYGVNCGISMDNRMKNMSVDDLASSSMVVFNDPRIEGYNASAATIFYFPTQNIDVHTTPYSSFNFKYDIEETQGLKNLMESALISNFENIKNIMKLIANKKH